MSNDTQIAAHMALVDEYAVTAVRRTQGSGGVATLDDSIRARAAVEASARQLAEQPGFVMVPVGDMAELREALDICVSLLESAKSNHLPRIIAAYTKADAIVKAETCDCPAKDMPFGRCCKARAALASPTAPSTEASEPVGEREAMHVITKCRDALSEELSAWDIDPPLHHVAEAHDLCERWLAARASKGTP